MAENGNLMDFVLLNGKLTAEMARQVFSQILEGVKYMHKEGKIVHRDLTLDNCFLDKHMNVKIGDFGAIKMIAEEGSKTLKPFVGTEVYMPAEVFRPLDYKGAPVDVYSLGVALFTMLVGEFPYARAGNENHHRFLKNPSHFLTLRRVLLEDEAIALLTSMLALEPADRPTINQLL
jgi:serine/threonine protein kinase